MEESPAITPLLPVSLVGRRLKANDIQTGLTALRDGEWLSNCRDRAQPGVATIGID